MEPKVKLKQIVNTTIKSCNADVRDVLHTLGNSLLKSGTTPGIIDAYLSGYGVEYVFCNLLEGRMWSNKKFNERNHQSEKAVMTSNQEESFIRFLEGVNIFTLQISESYGEENLEQFIMKVMDVHIELLKIKAITIDDGDLFLINNFIRRPIWVFLLIMSIFNLEFAMIPTRGESSEEEKTITI